MTNQYRIRFGTVGWQHAQWHGDFYPDDLPEDWTLPFYGNEFPVVAVPASAWSDEPSEQIEEWLDNSDVHFRFVFEWSWQNAADLRAFCQRLQPIQAKTLGIVLQVPWSACCAPGELTSTLIAIIADMPICLEIIDDEGVTPMTSVDFDNAAFKDLLASTKVSCCWHGVETNHAQFFRDSQFAITKIDHNQFDARQIRQVLEVCSAYIQSHEHMVVLFTGEPPALQKVREAMLMLELLA